MKEKEFDRIVRELQNGKRELLKRGITFCLSGRNNTTGQTWYASNRERAIDEDKKLLNDIRDGKGLPPICGR